MYHYPIPTGGSHLPKMRGIFIYGPFLGGRFHRAGAQGPNLRQGVRRAAAHPHQITRQHRARAPQPRAAMDHHGSSLLDRFIDELNKRSYLPERRRLHILYGQVQICYISRLHFARLQGICGQRHNRLYALRQQQIKIALQPLVPSPTANLPSTRQPTL